jgi:uncharacterized protein (TIGR03437 family)
MFRKLKLAAVALLGLGSALSAGTFGKVVAIGGQGSDLVLDESRGVLYVANFTANRIDVMSLVTKSVQTSINVAPQPSSMAMSPDNHYLVVTHFGNFSSPNNPSNALTVLDLTNKGQQTYALGNPPLGVAFGIDGLALVVTATDYLLFDPVLGTTQEVGTISGVVAQTLPVPPANFPPQITSASMTASGDGLTIFGMGGSSGTFTFKYNVTTHTVVPGQIVIASGTFGPRIVSASQDGSLFMAGWVMVNSAGTFVNFFPQHSNQLNIGTTLFDSNRGLLYSQINVNVGDAPVLKISDLDNLTLHTQLQLPENLAGKSVLSSDGNTIYGISDSGVLVLPVGSLAQAPQVAASQSDLVFAGSLCSRQVSTQSLTITNPGGGNTAFSISSSAPGLTVSPSSGVTPAAVKVSVDPNAFLNQNGTVTATLSITSAQAVNIPPPVRVLINSKSPNQRGTIVDVPGTLVDLLADPVRNQFYVLRQDTNQVLVFDGTNYTQTAALRTGYQPTNMAITFDQRYLLVGNAGSQIVNVYDLETLQATAPILMPSGHTALSIACSANAILAATEFYDGTHHIVRLDINNRTGTMPSTLGVFQNLTASGVALVASPNGSSIMAAESDGSVLLYDAVQDTFTVSRKDFTSLSGAYAASAFGQYIVGNNLFNASLVLTQQFDPSNIASTTPSASSSSSSAASTMAPSGFAFVDTFAFFTTTPAAASTSSSSSTSTSSSSTTTSSSSSSATTSSAPSSAPGMIQRIDLSSSNPSVSLSTPMAEASLVGTAGMSSSPFSRTLAPLYNRNAIINLTVSGFTVLAWNYAASVAPPHIDGVVNAANLTAALAPGGLISIFGEQLSPVNLATQEVPLPTALGDSCLTVNGLAVPMLFVSPGQINAQLPFETIGNVTMVLHTPGGVSDNFNLVVTPGAPSVFLSGTAGPDTDLPTILRTDDGQLVTASNPIHKNDTLLIYLTGLGQTNPAVPDGLPGPSSPLAVALTQPQVTLGGAGLQVLYAGLAPGEVGVYQINVKIPSSVPQGLSIPLTISQAGASTTINVRVVD